MAFGTGDPRPGLGPDLETEEAVDHVNGLAELAPEGEILPDKYDEQRAEDAATVIRNEAVERLHGLRMETLLEHDESEVVALTELGLSHSGIEVYAEVMANSDGVSFSIEDIDEILQNAHDKFQDAARTVDAIDLFDEVPPLACIDCGHPFDVDHDGGTRLPQRCPYCDCGPLTVVPHYPDWDQ